MYSPPQNTAALRFRLHRKGFFERFPMEEIGVFGSFARGEAFRDIDFFVTAPLSLKRLRVLRVWLRAVLGCAVDIMPEQYANPVVLFRAKKELIILKKRENDLLHLLDILQAIVKIQHYSHNFKTAERFYEAEEQLYFNACLNLLARLGEKVKKLSDETQANYPKIAWAALRGYRNRLVHEYEGIDSLITFEIIQEELPRLKRQLQEVVRKGIAAKHFDEEELAFARKSTFYQRVDFEGLI